MRVKCLAQEHDTMTRPGQDSEPLNPESSVLTILSPSLLTSLFRGIKTIGNSCI